MDQITISDRFAEWALKHLKELSNQEIESKSTTQNSLQGALANCTKKLDNLTTLMISDGNIDRSLLSDEEFRTRKNELLEEKRKLGNQLGTTDNQTNDWLEIVKEKFDFATKAKKKFKTATIAEKREIMFRLSSNLKLYNRNLVGLLENLYEPLRKVTADEPTVQLELEPKEITEKYGSLESKWSQNPLMLPALESIRNAVCGL